MGVAQKKRWFFFRCRAWSALCALRVAPFALASVEWARIPSERTNWFFACVIKRAAWFFIFYSKNAFDSWACFFCSLHFAHTHTLCSLKEKKCFFADHEALSKREKKPHLKPVALKLANDWHALTHGLSLIEEKRKHSLAGFVFASALCSTSSTNKLRSAPKVNKSISLSLIQERKSCARWEGFLPPCRAKHFFFSSFLLQLLRPLDLGCFFLFFFACARWSVRKSSRAHY